MADTITANLGLQLPQIFPGDQWGNKLNTNFAAIDVFAGGSTELTGARAFGTAAEVLADVALTYTPGTVLTVLPGQYLLTESEGFSYKVAAAAATDHHVATAGGVKLYVQAAGGFYNVQAFGAVGNGTTNDALAVDKAFTAAGATGVSCYVPDGVYSLAGTVAWDVSAGFEVNCAAGVAFVAASGFPVDSKLFLPSAASGPARFAWRGGRLDGRDMPARVTGAPDLLYIASANIKFVHIEDVDFLCNNTRAGTAGDSCLFISSGEDYFVSGCKFTGAVDAGVYISGDYTDTLGRRMNVSGNTFLECGVGIISKRRFQDHVFSGNNILSCSNGIILGGEADVSSTPGLKGTISGNVIKYVGRGIEARVAPGTVITGNRIEDYGVNSSGTPIEEHGIIISGSTNCVVSGNVVVTTEVFVPNIASAAIFVAGRTVFSILYPAEANIISGNSIANAALGISETSNANRNMFLDNGMTNVTGARYTVSGSQTFYRDIAPLTSRAHTAFGASGASPVSTSNIVIENSGDIVESVLTPNTATYTMLLGDPENNAVARVSYAHTIDRWSFRAGGAAETFGIGADNVRFGVRTASSDVPVTGYIEIRDLAGAIRRLAVVG